MTSLEDLIVDYLEWNPDKKAREIADALNFTRKDVNQALYNALQPRNLVTKNKNDEWALSKYATQRRKHIKVVDTNAAVSFDKDNREAEHAIELIREGKNVFVTGKAGTGKTTLLCKIREAYAGKKTIATLAPTGVAAQHAGGFTMHSFLMLPMTPYAPNYKKSDLFSLSCSSEEVVKNLDLIIIDEISMVRCDMLDAADSILRHYRKTDKPFGGVQIAMFGDLYQLMPVVKNEDWEVIKDFYETPYFFSSSVLSNLEYYICDLQKVYRQKDDQKFVDILNHVRVGKINLYDLTQINARYLPVKQNPNAKNAITLMTRNKKADQVNHEKLEALSGMARTYEARYSNWHEKMPTEKKLTLKRGTRVMFVKNDNQFKQYVNGTMGWVERLDHDAVYVRIDGEKEIVRVEPQRWDSFKFSFDKQTKSIRSEVVGYFSQIPLKLAWAVTIHKSQGLTFDEVYIDAADSFTYGQIYVALSRCRTLNGVHLLEKIPSHKIFADDKVQAYLGCKEESGKVLPLPSFKTRHKLKNLLSGNYIYFTISKNRYDSMKDGSKDRYSRKIASHEEALRIFESDGHMLRPNRIFKSQKKSWRYNDMNGGNCPFIVKDNRFLVLYCSGYDKKLVCYIDGRIEIDADTETKQWRVTVPISETFEARTRNGQLSLIPAR